MTFEPSLEALVAEFEQSEADPHPWFVSPQLAERVDEAVDGEGWLHELKLDGYRLVVVQSPDGVRCLTRRGHDWTGRFKHIARAVEDLGAKRLVLDGEAVVLRPDGVSDFQALQNALQGGSYRRSVFVAFDLLHLAGWDLHKVPLVDRKRALARLLLGSGGPLSYLDHIDGPGPVIYEQACKLGAEGIISKRANARYRAGERSSDWVKTKCMERQEFVVVGFTDPSGARPGFGSLLVAYCDGREYQYVGRVGTGFDQKTLKNLHEQLSTLEIPAAKAVGAPRDADDIHWVEPQMVVAVEFTAWTDDQILRHPSFKGVREDLEPEQVTLERPADAPSNDAQQAPPRVSRGKMNIAGIPISNPDRLVYPDAGLSKADVAEYYARVAPRMLEFAGERPLSLLRCPTGLPGECFFQKNVEDVFPDAVRTVEWPDDPDRKVPWVDSPGGLVGLAQMGVLEMHAHGLRRDRFDRPDICVFDLDPGPGVEWPKVVEAAHIVREFLADAELTSFVRTSGGKGLHLVVPLVRRHAWDEVKDFSKQVAQTLSQAHPKRFVATSTKAKRKGKIYIDYLRNSESATAISNFSLRARPGAPVATPLAWDELDPDIRPEKFNLSTVLHRVDQQRQRPWAGFDDNPQYLTKAVREHVRAQ